MAVSLLRCPQVPPGGKGVDLCTLTGEAPTMEQGVRALLDVPREHLLVEMGYTDRRSRLPAAAWALAETGARQDLADAPQAAYQALVQPRTRTTRTRRRG